MGTDGQDSVFERVAQRVHPGARLVRSWPLTGGVSARVTALEVALPGGGRERLVVRQYGEADLRAKPQVATQEFRLLGILRPTGLPVPRGYDVDESGAILPGPYLAEEYIDGETVAEPPDVTGFVRRLAGVLAEVHAIGPDRSFLPSMAERAAQRLAERPAQLDEGLSEGRVRAALAGAWPPPGRNAMAVLHGDFWPGNTLWRDGRLVGVIDWEDAAAGDPLADLANGRLEILMFLGERAMNEFTAHYRSLMGSLDYTALPCWDLQAALRPAGKMAGWGLDESTLARLRAGHRAFVDRALGELPV